MFKGSYSLDIRIKKANTHTGLMITESLTQLERSRSSRSVEWSGRMCSRRSDIHAMMHLALVEYLL